MVGSKDNLSLENGWKHVSDRLRRRGLSARFEGVAYIILMTGIVGSLVFFFVATPSPKLVPIYSYFSAHETAKSGSGLFGKEVPTPDTDDTVKPPNEAQNSKPKGILGDLKDWGFLPYAPDPMAQVLQQIGQWVLKGGAVFLAIYLTQIVVGFIRYQFRMYHLLCDCADAIDLAEGDIEKLEKIRAAVSTDTIDFGKMPQTQVDKAFDAIKEIAAAVTTRGRG